MVDGRGVLLDVEEELRDDRGRAVDAQLDADLRNDLHKVFLSLGSDFEDANGCGALWTYSEIGMGLSDFARIYSSPEFFFFCILGQMYNAAGIWDANSLGAVRRPTGARGAGAGGLLGESGRISPLLG